MYCTIISKTPSKVRHFSETHKGLVILPEIYAKSGWIYSAPVWWPAHLTKSPNSISGNGRNLLVLKIYPSIYSQKKGEIYHLKSNFFSLFLHFLYKWLIMSRCLNLLPIFVNPHIVCAEKVHLLCIVLQFSIVHFNYWQYFCCGFVSIVW